MSKINDGGPAYPAKRHEMLSPGKDYRTEVSYPGMSKRDWLAGQVLAGLCANPGGPFQSNAVNGWDIVNCDAQTVAWWAYKMADAMLAERAKGGA
ncbi:hypothetical protein [Mesorhizobium amorphae]|uniref:hypothetical protein n=1 Tax=Mesorhizobium amorphae TaxID=71433 RepID=UPI001183F7B6|nr:hypothetical protein [Mesorhizobium amorphae]